MDNPEKLATFGYTRDKTQGNQEWTIQRNWQHLGTLDTRHRAIKNGQLGETGNIGYTRHKTQGNQEWTIQRNW